jgi:type I site-specific restriction endonuclease
MGRSEWQTRLEPIEPSFRAAGWAWDPEVEIGPGRVTLSGAGMHDPSQRFVADYVLRLYNIPLAVLQEKAEAEPAADGMQQVSETPPSRTIRSWPRFPWAF